MLKINRRAWAAGSAMLALAATLMPGVAPAQDAKKTLRFVQAGNLTILDPIFTTAYVTRDHGYMVYDTLFASDEKLNPQPQMVDTWTVSPDRKVYTFKLRPNLKFHSGNALTADFGAVGHEALQQVDVFIVNKLHTLDVDCVWLLFSGFTNGGFRHTDFV